MKKCRNCKNPFEPRFNTLEKFCWNPECKTIEAMEKLRKLKQIHKRDENERIKKIKQQLKTRSTLKNELQRIFNEFIRIRDRHQPCISCGCKLPEKYDAGHFFSVGGYPNLRFAESNVHAQCVECNHHRNGNVHEYRIGLIQRIGMDELEQLERIKHVPLKLTKPEIMEMMKIYREKIRELKKNV
jgi:hypothetical protein